MTTEAIIMHNSASTARLVVLLFLLGGAVSALVYSRIPTPPVRSSFVLSEMPEFFADTDSAFAISIHNVTGRRLVVEEFSTC
jgi:hypothetical protein